MKKLAGLLLLTLSAFYGFAQIGEVTKVTATMSQGNQKGYKILIPESTLKTSNDRGQNSCGITMVKQPK